MVSSKKGNAGFQNPRTRARGHLEGDLLVGHRDTFVDPIWREPFCWERCIFSVRQCQALQRASLASLPPALLLFSPGERRARILPASACVCICVCAFRGDGMVVGIHAGLHT